MGLLDRFFGTPTPERFARQVINQLRQAGDPRQVEFDRDNFQLRFYEDGSNAGVANLTNFFAEHQQLPRKERSQHLRHIVRGLLTYLKEVPSDFEDARHDLRPIVRSRAYIELLRLQSQLEGHEGPSIPHELIGDHLCAALVYDLPESMQSVSAEQLESWGVTYYEAMEAAHRNLAEVDVRIAQLGSSVYATATGDAYDASRLLMLDLIHQLDVEGAPVALVPNRDTLLIAGSEDEEGLGAIAELADSALEAPRPMNALPVILINDEWHTWELSADHPHYQKFRLLEIKSLGAEYADQKALLESLYHRDGEDVFVASYSAFQDEEQRYVSYCVWGEGIDSLLPRADQVMFARREDETFIRGNWDFVQQVVGDLMVPTDAYPQRFRVREFPSEHQLAEIEAGPK
ncbi:MAG: DUF1444 family protein [Maioricimonas sp. JB045]